MTASLWRVRRPWPGRKATPENPAPEPAADDDAERGPLRRCIVTREHGDRARMLRFVLSPDRLIVPDLAAKLPGRGMWLSARRDVVEVARTRGAFARAARGPVSTPPDLASLIRSGLTRRVTDLLGLARRAGQAVSGFAKVREALVQGHASLIVHASDGSEEECHRLLSGARDIPVVRPLAALELGSVFGRDHVVHVAVAPGRLAEALAAETFRLAGMAGPDGVGGIEAVNNRARRRRGGDDRTDG